MAHIHLRHYVAQRPHGAKLRKRAPRKAAPVKPSHKNELWYKTNLLAITHALRATTNAVILPVLRSLMPDVVTDADPHIDAITGAFERLAGQFGGIDNLALRLAGLAVQKNKQTVDERLIASIKQSVRVDVTPLLRPTEPLGQAMAKALTDNVDLIKSIPEQYFDKLKVAIDEGFSAGLRFEALADNIARIADVTDSRAKLIARDQTSKMNGAFNEVRQTELGIDEYQWATAGDERVREDHAENDGKVFRWDDPPATGHPGEDINCRCVAIPIFNLDDVPE